MRFTRPHQFATAAVFVAGGITLAAAMTFGTDVTGDDIVDAGMVFIEMTEQDDPEHPTWRVRNRCTGTLIDPQWVLTARHCVTPLVGQFGQGGVLRASASEPFGRGTPHAAVWAGSDDPADQPMADRFVVAGSIADATTPEVLRPALWAFDARGLPPAGFGEDDHVTIPRLTGVTRAELTAAAITPGGQVIGAGWALVDGEEHVLVMRFSRDGFLRTTPFPAPASYGASEGFAAGFLGRARAVAVDPVNGDVIVAGTRGGDGAVRWFAARFDVTGALLDGYDYLDDPAYGGALRDVAVAGGHVVVLGTLDRGESDAVPVLAVLGPDGPITSPQVLATWDGSEPRALDVDRAGGVIAVGQNAARTRIVVTRHLAPSLTPVTAFGDHGVAVRSVGPPDPRIYPTSFELTDARVDREGRVVLGLTVGRGGSRSFGLARFTANGFPDDAFGQSGFLPWTYKETELAVGDLSALAMAVGPEHTMIAGSRLADGAPIAALFRNRHDLAPAHHKVYLGEFERGIRRVVMHHDPGYDVALLQLTSPILPETAITWPGFADITSLPPGTPLVCYGSRRFENPAYENGRIVRGELLLDKVDGAVATVVSACEHGACSAFEPGDAGGACFVKNTGSGSRGGQLGVNYARVRGDVESHWMTGAARQYAGRGDRLAGWVQMVLEDPAMQP